MHWLDFGLLVTALGIGWAVIAIVVAQVMPPTF